MFDHCDIIKMLQISSTKCYFTQVIMFSTKQNAFEACSAIMFTVTAKTTLSDECKRSHCNSVTCEIVPFFALNINFLSSV